MFLAKFTDIQGVNKPCNSFHKSLHTLRLESKFVIIKTNIYLAKLQLSNKISKFITIHTYRFSPLYPSSLDHCVPIAEEYKLQRLLLKLLLLSITIAFLYPEVPLTLVFESQDSSVSTLTGLHAERPVFISRYEHIL